jgi:dUTPase
VRAAEDVILRPTMLVKIPLGIRCFAPEGWWLEIRPRSSTFAKKELSSLYGVVDESYEGEIMFACQWLPDIYKIPPEVRGSVYSDSYQYSCQHLSIKKGDRIAQIVPVKRQEMTVVYASNELFDEMCQKRGLERGAGGFGSTG